MPELSRQRRRFRDADTIVNGEILRRAAAKKDEDENED
jgi:hypothetical protein